MLKVEEAKQKLPFRDVLKRTHGDNWAAKGNVKCPFHDDKDPSMQINQTSGYCHSCGKKFDIFDLWKHAHGKGIPEALEAFTMMVGGNTDSATPKSEKDDPPEWVKQCHYIYTDEEGRNLIRVHRFHNRKETGPQKKFTQDRYENKRWRDRLLDTRRVLYRLQEVLAATHVIIVEGEKDADNLSTLESLTKKRMAATTCLGGGKAWKNQALKWDIHKCLKGKKVTIIPDNDDTGKIHAADVADSLKAIKVDYRVVNIPPHLGKDVSDFLKVRSEHALMVMIKNAWKRKVSGLEACVAMDIYKRDLPEPMWVVNDILCEGLTVFAGDPKIGKSWTMLHLVLCIGGGSKFANKFKVNTGRSLYFALEDNERRAKSRIEKMLTYHDVRCLRQTDLAFTSAKLPQEKSSDPTILDQIRDWHRDNAELARCVVIDTFQMIRPDRKRSDIYGEDTKDLVVLRQLAQELKIAIVVVHHTAKATTPDSMTSISGSFGIGGTADTVWVMRKVQNHNQASLYVRGRDVIEAAFNMKQDEDSCVWEYTGMNKEQVRISKSDRIYSFLLNQEKQMAHLDEISVFTDIEKKQVSKLLNCMEKAKLVQKPKFSVNSRDGMWQAIKQDGPQP